MRISKCILLTCALLLFGLLAACSSRAATPTSLPPTVIQPSLTLTGIDEPTARPYTATPTPTPVPPTGTDEPTARPYTPTPTPTSTPTLTPTGTDEPTARFSTPTPDYAAMAKDAKILVYDLIYGDTSMGFGKGYSKRRSYSIGALERLKYDFTRDGDLEDEDWDLVIVEFWGSSGSDGLMHYLDEGGAVILQTLSFDLGETPNHRNYDIEPLLGKCGVEFQGDYTWGMPHAVRWTDPNHPILQQPNPIALDQYEANYFMEFSVDGEDVGDLLRKTPGSEATLLGVIGDSPDSEGVVTVCYDGRLIIQTFDMKDDYEEEMIALWENYIQNALQSRFAYRAQHPLTTPQPIDIFKRSADIIIYYGGMRIWEEKRVLQANDYSFQATTASDQFQKALRRQMWDLILIDMFGGGWLDSRLVPLIQAQVESGASVILMDLPNDRVNTYGYTYDMLLDSCGIEYQEQTGVSTTNSPLWLISDHPLVSVPNKNIHLMAQEDVAPDENSIIRFQYLFKKKTDSKAVILAGFDETGEGDGLLVACESGPLIIGSDSLYSFSKDMYLLWENIIDYALTTRFDYLNK